MFATKSAKLKLATGATQPHSRFAAKRRHPLQQCVENQMILRRGFTERSNPCEEMVAGRASPVVSWNFGKVQVLQRDRMNETRDSFPARQSLVSSIQAKLLVGTVNDPMEDEADRVANQATHMPPPSVSFAAAQPQISRKCAACEEEQEQIKNEPLGAQAAAGQGPAIVQEVLRSPGRPLDPGVLTLMESRFGHDFSHVRVHIDTSAAESARAVNALAYTVGHHVIFDEGQYAPQTSSGVRLLAHELAHTLQQPTFAATSPANLTVSMPGDAAEREADRATDAVMCCKATCDAGTSSSASPVGFGSLLLRQPKAPASQAPAHLHPCDAKTQMPIINKAVVQAKQSATDAVQGLQELLNTWGKVPSTTSQKATARALATGFAIEPDKTDWVKLGIADAAEVKAIDKRDHDAVSTILGNFKKIEADLPKYGGAPACNLSTGQSSLTSPCFGCADAEYDRCKENPLRPGAIAFVFALGKPSSPIFFCPIFFGHADPGDLVLHEAAHLQDFAARDTIGEASYYGCPVMPQEPFQPGLTQPSEFMQIADSYRCFVLTQRETTAAWKEIEKIPRK
jgi:Domain of unknown function (DUF4157)